MHTLRGRFILSHVLPLLLIVPLAGIALLYILDTQWRLADISAELNQQAQLIANAASRSDIWDDSSRAQAFITAFSGQAGGQIWLWEPSGQLWAGGDNQTPPMAATLLAGEQQVIVVYGQRTPTAQVSIPVRDVNQQLIGIVQMTRQLESVSSQFGRLRDLVIGVLSAELLLGCIVGLVLALRLERPIQSVTSAVSDIAQGQRINPVPEEGPDEIRLLAQAVNLLADRLKSLEETRRHLLANLVHELGRPLGALRAAVHVLRRGADADPALRQELLTGIEAEIDRLQPLLDDLTRLHGQSLGRRELDCRQVALSDWLPPILSPWQAAAAEKSLQWRSDIPAGLPVIALDGDQMARAMGNLLSNAIKYTPSGGTIIVSAGRTAENIWLRVTDDGPGIAPADQTQVFEPFYRGQQPQRFPKGLGLGLTIVRDIVQAHQGRITLDSQLGVGSQFTIYLPIHPAAEPGALPAASADA